MTPAERHRVDAAGFTARVREVAPPAWDAPTPVSGWVARDIVDHLVSWFPGFLEAGSGLTLPAGPPVADDPVAAWTTQAEAVQALLDDPAAAATTFALPPVGEMPLPEAIDRFYTADVFLHTWDLARATGQDERLDPGRCAALLAGMEPMDEVLRASGQYGPAVPVAPDADVQTRLIGFIGRDPEWRQEG